MANYIPQAYCSLPQCGRRILPHARASCDNCGRVVCRRHRPLFVQYWQCPTCDQTQAQFNSQTTPSQQGQGITMAAVQGTERVAELDVLQRMRVAEQLYHNEDVATADQVLTNLYIDLMGGAD